MEDSTSISDLPNPTSGGGIVQPTTEQRPSMPPAYSDNHNNNSAASQVIDPKYMNQIISGIQQTGGSTLGSIPSRDIPMNTLEIQQDEFARANYIPPPSTEQINYVENYEIKKKHNKTSANMSISNIFENYYISILAALLYFIFQMRIINHIMFKYLKFLHNSDGNLTYIGNLLKSLLFGTILSGLVFVLNDKIN